MIGTIINAVAVIFGSILGLILHSRLPKKIVKIVFQGIGLFTLFLGISMSLKTSEYLLMIGSLVLGSIIGEWIDIDAYFTKLSEFLKKKLRIGNEKFSEGFVTAFLLYCMGSMTILGAIEEGLGQEPNLLLAKSFMDGVSSIALSAGLGVGVLFSAVPLLIYQGGLTIITALFGDMFAQVVVNELTAVGGILLIGLGLNILEIKKLKILNMLPALIVVVVLSYLFLLK